MPLTGLLHLEPSNQAMHNLCYFRSIRSRGKFRCGLCRLRSHRAARPDMPSPPNYWLFAVSSMPRFSAPLLAPIMLFNGFKMNKQTNTETYYNWDNYGLPC